ncbi:hypothetical protein MRB53_015519 [Persea americana]|uniref:Uncharacterized protein n=1 Tax=Persea americana TaxID=3435 RepID=A0ACC2LZH3_PERAE|nr:hypothetical protein MRB53_015519 [Persea americana]
MENGRKEWKLRPNASLSSTDQISIRGLLEVVKSNLAGGDERPTITLGQGDPSHFPSFRTVSTAEEAIVTAVQSGKYNCYSPAFGFPTARRAIAEYLSKDLPYKLSEEDVYITSGCQQAIEVVMSVLAHPNANILLPRPCFPIYNSYAAYLGMEVRHVDLLPERNWEMDLEAVEDLVDDNTVAIVIVNPGNPCGNVYTYEYLAKVIDI